MVYKLSPVNFSLPHLLAMHRPSFAFLRCSVIIIVRYLPYQFQLCEHMYACNRSMFCVCVCNQTITASCSHHVDVIGGYILRSALNYEKGLKLNINLVQLDVTFFVASSSQQITNMLATTMTTTSDARCGDNINSDEKILLIKNQQFFFLVSFFEFFFFSFSL